jgi:hypothetical protein
MVSFLESINPFSVVGDVYGAYTARQSAEKQNKINQENLALQREGIAKKEGAIDAGTVGPYKTAIGRPGGEGTPIVTALTGGLREAAEAGAEQALPFQKTKGAFGQAGSALADTFRTKYPSAVRDPLSLDDARGIVTADENRLKNAILNRGLSDAAMLGQRTHRGISGVGSSGISGPNAVVAEFQKRILPQIQMGGEKEALGLTDADVDRFGRQTGQVAGQALATSGGGYMPPPPSGPSFTQGISPMMQMPGAPTVPYDYTDYATGAGISNIFNSIAAMQNQATARDDYNKLIRVLANRGLGDATTYGGSFPQIGLG